MRDKGAPCALQWLEHFVGDHLKTPPFQESRRHAITLGNSPIDMRLTRAAAGTARFETSSLRAVLLRGVCRALCALDEGLSDIGAIVGPNRSEAVQDLMTIPPAELGCGPGGAQAARLFGAKRDELAFQLLYAGACPQVRWPRIVATGLVEQAGTNEPLLRHDNSLRSMSASVNSRGTCLGMAQHAQ